MPISIFIVEAHELVRTGIQLGCQQQADFSFVGHVATIADAFNEPPDTSPDVLVIDPASINGCDDELFSAWRSAYPECKVLAMASDNDAMDANNWISKGITGFIRKDSPIQELILAIRIVYQGRIFVSHPPHVNVPPTNHPSSMAKADAVTATADVDLSERERQVLTMIADGMTNKQAASRLFLSVKTVETYRSRVMRKHNLRDRKDLVSFASQL